MNVLRLSIIALLLNLFLFYNIERLDVYSLEPINIQTFVYVLAIVVVLSIIGFSKSWRFSVQGWALSWEVIYLVCKLFLFNDRPILGGMYTYITITEHVFLFLTVFLSLNIAHHLHDFEDAVENITFGGIRKRIYNEQQGLNNANTEMYRSRRYERPLSVVVIEPEKESIEVSMHRSVQRVQQEMMSRYVFLGLARVVSTEMRRMDIAVEQTEEGRLIIICPETTIEGARVLVSRIQKMATEQLGLTIEHGISSFPEEAVTFDELLLRAEKRLNKKERDQNRSLEVIQTQEEESEKKANKSVA